MSRGLLLFVGCGPGAADLLTLRAVDAIERADVVIWNAAQIDRATARGVLSSVLADAPTNVQDTRARS